jgi:N-acetylglucosamine-6-phosphate deacetylase
MPTVATNATEVYHQCIDAIKDYWNKGGEGILGLHVEGPWINAAKKGAHIESFIHSPSLQEVKDLLNYGKDVIKIITLAPEVCSYEVIEYILDKGVVVSAGHSNATYKEANIGFSYGITVATHLYNAMSPLQHREPGLLGAILDSDKVKASIIPDGHHVDFAAIRIAKQVMKERLFVITDAVTETDSGYYQHTMVGDKYESMGILSGSALTMNKAVRNLVTYCNVEIGEALRMCSLYPAQVMNMHHSLGKIKTGYKASLVALNDNFDVISII